MQALVVGLAVLICSCQQVYGSCRRADWWFSFDSKGLSKCDSDSEAIRGFYRNVQGNPDYIERLENPVCCSRSYPYGTKSTFMYANWWSTLNNANTWARCPTGFFLSGLYRSDGKQVNNIEEGRCMKPADHPYHYGACYDHDITVSFDSEGVSQCDANYFVTGFYKSNCNHLYCIEKLRCCKMAPRPDVLDSLARVKTIVMDRTLYNMALLAHYLGYGWCSGCRAPWVGEDFRRNGDTLEADQSGRCEGYMSNKRLSINYANWSFGKKNIVYGTPLITDLSPQTIDTGVIENNSPTETTRTITRTEESIRTVTHSITSAWKQSHELGISITYSPPGGSVSASASYTFSYENSESTTDSEANTQKNILSVSDAKTMPPYSRTEVTLTISKTKTTVTYIATVIPRFTAEFRGFLRWGGGYDNPGTNYHHEHRGSGGRPTFNYRFGDENKPFYEALKYQSDTFQRPWEWGDMKAAHSNAQNVINQLTDEGLYEFELEGIFRDVIGKKIDVIWSDITNATNTNSKRMAPLEADESGVVDMGNGTSTATDQSGDPEPEFVVPPSNSTTNSTVESTGGTNSTEEVRVLVLGSMV